MTEREHEKFRWMDLIWLVFLGGLAVLPPVDGIHKQLILAAIAALQLSEALAHLQIPQRGRAYVVLLKILLCHSSSRSHRRRRHQQQLLSDLLSLCRHGRGLLRPRRHAHLDRARLRRLLRLSLSLCDSRANSS